MSSLFGAVDRAKVKNALLEYRIRLCAIVVSALAINFSVLYVVLQNLNLVLLISTLYVMVALSAILFSEVEASLNYKSPSSPEFYQPETLEHDRYTALWKEACIKTGFCSGGVYVISRFSSDQNNTFALARSPLFVKGKRMSALFMSEEMLGKFTEMQMKAIVLHECGHMRWTPLGVRYAVLIASLPISMILLFVFFVRSKSPERHLTRGLYLAERILYFMSHFHAQQSEEYAADAHAAEQMGTATHIIDALAKAERILSGDLEVRNIVRNAHLNAHPSTFDRIARLRALHEDDPH
jgi:Zn-dependent protease with chaperone function